MTSIQCDQRSLDIVCSVFDAYTTTLFLPITSSAFALAASFSLGNAVADGVNIEAGKGLVGWILRNKQPLLVNNFDQGQSHLGYYQGGEEAHIRAFMGCPLPGGGALCVDSKRQYSFSDKDQKILQLFAELISSYHALETGGSQIAASYDFLACLELLQELRHKFPRWPVFLQNFVKVLAESTGFDYCAFAARDAAGTGYVVESENALLVLQEHKSVAFPLNSGLAGWVFRNDLPVFSDGSDGVPPAALFAKAADMPHFSVVVCLPLIVNRATQAVLCLANMAPLHVPDAMHSFVAMATDHLSLYLENIYHKNRVHSLLPKAEVYLQGNAIQTKPHDGER